MSILLKLYSTCRPGYHYVPPFRNSILHGRLAAQWSAHLFALFFNDEGTYYMW